MRKVTVVTLLVLLVLAAGGYIATYRPFLGGGYQKVQQLSEKWMEDLQFKDFRSSSLYHHPLDRDRVDIGRAFERLFLVKPELLDIMDYRLVSTDIDSTGERARVKVETRYKRLNKDKEPKEAKLMLYWMKRHPDCPVGATCGGEGTCKNEFGKTVYPAEDGSVEDNQKMKAPEPAAEGSEPFDCDPGADRRWFMNLDSTLKEKEYQRK